MRRHPDGAESTVRPRRRRARAAAAALAAGAALATLPMGAAPSAGDTTTFQNLNPVRFAGHPGLAPPWAADPYPSAIDVSGVVGTVSDVNVALHGVNCVINDENIGEEYPDDLDVLLVGPTGASVVLMSDLFGQNQPPGSTFANLQVVLNDEAAAALPGDTNPYVGTTGQSVIAKPSDDDDDPDENALASPADPARPGFVLDTFPAPGWPGNATGPAPNPPSTNPAGLSVFDGTDPNGTWRLFLADDFAGPEWCTILNGWTLQVTTGGTPEPPPPTLPPTTSTSSTTSTTVVGADLAVRLTGPTTARAGRKVTFAISATNNGPTNADHMVITDNLPAAFTLSSINKVKGMVCAVTGHILQCTLSNLGVGKTVSVSVNGSYAPAGTYTHSAGVGASTSDPNPVNNRAQVVTTVTS